MIRSYPYLCTTILGWNHVKLSYYFTSKKQVKKIELSIQQEI